MKNIYKTILFILLITTSSFVASNNLGFVDGKTKITRFYPNPASSFINFEYAKSLEKGHTLVLYNFIGKKVSEVQISGTNSTISLDGFFRGIYIFQIRDKNARIVDSGKFQVLK